MRAALGASRARLLQQTLCETVLLSLIGATLGAGLATNGIDLITKFLGSSLPASAQVALDWEVLLFTLLTALLTGLLAGLLPGFRLANTNVQEAL